MPDEDENFAGPLFLDIRNCWRHVQRKRSIWPISWDPRVVHYGCRIHPNKCPVQDYECNNRKLFEMKDLIVPE